MTALTQFARLESDGLWRDAPEAQRREVIVSFGDATLVLRDSAERPLTHWSLAALERLNPGKRPALFTPDPDGTETLEISDPTMIDAIETVRRALARGRPRPGRLRWTGLALSAALVAGLAIFWFPGALTRQTLDAVPEVGRAEIGAALLDQMQPLAGRPCRNPLGSQALTRLHGRLFGPSSPGRIVVLPGGPPAALALPGGLITVNRAIVEDTEDPAAAAGAIVAAAATASARDPLEALLEGAGLRETFRLFTTGALSDRALRAHAEALLAAPPPPPEAADLLPAFEAALVPSTPYAFARDLTGESTLPLIEADPMAGRSAPPVLGDGDWVGLQGICGG